jgi:hypothetical protein
MIMSYDGYQEVLESEKKEKDELNAIKEQFSNMQSRIQSLISAFSNMQDQTQVDGMTRTLYGSGLIKAAAKAAYHATKSKSVLTKDATSTKTKSRL